MLTTRYIFAFFGKKRTGKDTIAKQLRQFLIDSRYVELNDTNDVNDCAPLLEYAGPLKRLSKGLFHHIVPDYNVSEDPGSNIVEYVKIQYPQVYRSILCCIGDAIKSVNGEDYLTKEMVRRINSNSGRVFIITDGRYESELAALDELYGTSTQVVPVLLANDPFTSETTGFEAHESETSLETVLRDRFDYVLDLKAKEIVLRQRTSEGQAYDAFDAFLSHLEIT